MSQPVHCEDQLMTSLQCDEKEKLRQKLLLLQREYLRTAQRLQRAERSGVVRKPVASCGKQPPTAPHGENRQQEVGKSSLTLTFTHGDDRCQGIDLCGNSDLVKPLMPSDVAHTTDPIHGSTGPNQPSPTSQFRSRLSRQCKGTRTVNSVKSKDSSKLNRIADARLPEATDGLFSTDASQNEELHSGTDSDSSSLLLAHWNTVNNKKGCFDDRNIHGASEQGGEGTVLEKRDPHSQYLLLRPQNTGLHNAGEVNIHVANESPREVDIVTEETAKDETKCEDSQVITVGNRGDGGQKLEKGAGLLDSCTLVDGLLFPAEYYVRTTRRMASSQSQPDLQAVILSQLNIGRPQRSRGGARRPGNRKHESQSGGSPVAAAASVSPSLASQDTGAAAGPNSLTCVSVDAASTPPAPAARRTRGRRRRRGRPRGRSLAQKDGATQISQQDDQAASGSLPVSHPTQEGDGSKQPAHSQPVLTGGTKQSVKSSATSGHRLYPIFLMGSSKTSDFPHIKPGTTDWQPLLLPSSPLYQTPLLPRPSLPWSSAVNFEVLQDFHLPDDQFASLKLHKLRQVAQDRGLETFSPPSYNTRRSLRQFELHSSQPPLPLSLPLSLTPAVTQSSNPSGAAQTPTQSTKVPLVPEDQCEGSDTKTLRSNISEFSTCTDESHVATEKNQPHAPEDTGEEPWSSSRSAQHHCTDASCCPPVEAEITKGGADELRGPPEDPQTGTVPALQPLAVHTQPVLSSPPASAPRPLGSAPPSSPPLPSLGLSPQVEPLSCSPSALTWPPPPPPPSISHTLDLPPPPLCPGPPPSPDQAPTFPAELQQVPPEAPAGDERVAAAGRNQSDFLDEQRDQRVEENEARLFMGCTHTLKSPAGGSLVDACCVPGGGGSLCVAAAGKWAVCLWAQNSPSDWTLKHTWSFSEPVISVLAVPDTAGLICVTLGRLEIREVRMLCSSSFSQTLLCHGTIQTVVALSASRVVCSLHSASGSTLQLLPLSDGCRPVQPRYLVAPDVCVRALAPVDGLPDALIGTDEGSLLFIWNLKSGQMLQRIVLPDDSLNSTCVRAYSSCGVLLVLLQHQLLNSLEEDQEVGVTVRQTSWLSLLAVNPLNGRSAWASRLYPPEAWSGRLCEADAHSSGSVVGLSQSGCVCLWELGSGGPRGGFSRMVPAPEAEGWQLARWGRGGTLVTGHHNGDVTLHCPQGAPCSAERKV